MNTKQLPAVPATEHAEEPGAGYAIPRYSAHAERHKQWLQEQARAADDPEARAIGRMIRERRQQTAGARAVKQGPRR